jgi:hypothetical protein
LNLEQTALPSLGRESELSADLKHAANRDIELLCDRQTSQSLRPQPGNAAAVRVECRWPTKLHTFGSRQL